MPEHAVVTKTWSELTTRELYDIVTVRTEVFYVEQRIDEQEFDYRDLEPTTRHLWIADERGVAAYLRVIEDAEPTERDARHSFGRVVVRSDRRGEGLAQVLIAEVVRDFGHLPMLLHAQEYIRPLYARFGFEVFGEPFIEAGIPHVLMYRPAPR